MLILKLYWHICCSTGPFFITIMKMCEGGFLWLNIQHPTIKSVFNESRLINKTF